MQKVIDWIDEVREETKKILKSDAEKILKIVKKGKFETESFYPLLMEVRDNERDDALLSLIREMIVEELRKTKRKGTKK